MTETTHKSNEQQQNQRVDLDQEFDEITFALFYDGELDAAESLRFEEALSNSELAERYGQWLAVRDTICDHFENLESQYSLEGFSDRVIEALPEQSPWSNPRLSSESVAKESVSFGLSLRRWFAPMLVGGLTAAAIIIIAQSLSGVTQHNTRSTVLINYPEQGDEAQTSPVIWIVEGEEDSEEAEMESLPSPSGDKDDDI